MKPGSFLTMAEDLVDEILCHLKGLRSTCQRWNRLYRDRRFARKHFDKSPNQLLLPYLSHEHQSNKSAFQFDSCSICRG